MALDADSILVGGRVFTASRERPWAQALAVQGEKLAAVGSDAQVERWSSRRTRRIDLRGRVVVPGFVDAHAHLAEEAGDLGRTDLGGAATLDGALERLRKKADAAPEGSWVVGTNWDESRWPEARYVAREDLDRVSKVHRVLAIRVDWHMASLNSLALEDARDLAALRGFEVDRSGRPTGILKEDAFGAFYDRLKPDEAAIAEGLPTMIRRAHRMGITSIHDILGEGEWRAYQQLHRRGRLRLRIYGMLRDPLLGRAVAAGLLTGFGDLWLRVGAIKVFADGSMGAHTAALSRPYADLPTERGVLIHSRAELESLLGAAERGGFQTATHAIGDEAIRTVLDVLESLPRDGRSHARHRIEHFELPSDEDLRRSKGLHAIASCQPNFVGQWSGPGEMYERRLGSERVARNNPYRRIARQRIPLCFGSDGMPYGPLNGLHWAVNGFHRDQRLSVEEAVRAYTVGGAYAAFEERLKGTLEPGKLADFVILRGDPFREPDRILEMGIESTWIAGQRVAVASAKR